MEKLTFEELRNAISKHNKDFNVGTQFGDRFALDCVMVFKDGYLEGHKTIESRSFKFTSDNKYFLENMIGFSIFGTSLDNSEMRRLDADVRHSPSQIEYCYIIDSNPNEKMFEVEITTTFTKVVHVLAIDEEHAMAEASDYDATDSTNFDTTYKILDTNK